jgi:hypothetical protein
MSFVLSLALTGLAVSPVFLLAGWSGRAQPARLRQRFNALNF